MTEQNPAILFQGSSHPGEDLRRWMGTASHSAGIVGYGDLKVTEHAGTPNMSVDVAGGRCFIHGSEATYQGTYAAENRGTTVLVISAAHASNPRKDLVVAKVQDSNYSGGTKAWSLAVVTGTPAASPAEPTAPANSIVLAMVDVPAASTSVINARVTDRRTYGARAWPQPWGYIAQAVNTSNVTFTTVADITGLSATFTAVANRRYRVKAHMRGYSSAADDTLLFHITDSSNNIVGSGGHQSHTNTGAASTMVEAYVTGSGSVTYKVRGERATGGSGTCTAAAASTTPCILTVEDIGPVSVG